VDAILLKLGLPDDARSEFVALFTEKKISAGDVLFDYNDDASEIYFLQEGKLAVHKYTGFLEKMQVIALLDPGAVVGESALLKGHRRKTRITAVQDANVFCLREDDFTDFLKKFPESGFSFLKHLFLTVTLRLEKTSERLAHIL